MSWVDYGQEVEELLEQGDLATARRDFERAQVEYAVAALTAFMTREATPPGSVRRRYHGLLLFANARLPPDLRVTAEPLE